MDQRFSYVSITSYISETKSNIISHAITDPRTQNTTKLSKINRNILGSDIAQVFVNRHHNELQRCSHFSSLASIFNETTTKDQHHLNWNRIKRKYLMQLFQYFSKNNIK